jgi:hypothetical protein
VGALVTIDCEYVMPQLAASYLREEGGEVAFIEANTTHAVPRLLAALEKAGLAPEAVKYVIVTHVHLDHAGGASALMRACPNATLLAHPRAARHLIDPTRLVASARHVYGEDAFERLYGTIEAIDASRVRALEDGERVTLGTAPLHFLHTRGHANHHFVVHDEAKQVVYTGDAFGLVYPAMQRSTHFGLFEDVQVIADQLIHWLELSTRLAEQGAKSGDEVGTLEQRFKWQLDQEFELAASRSGLKLTEADRQLIRFDSELNGQGLAAAAVKQRG